MFCRQGRISLFGIDNACNWGLMNTMLNMTAHEFYVNVYPNGNGSGKYHSIALINRCMPYLPSIANHVFASVDCHNGVEAANLTTSFC